MVYYITLCSILFVVSVWLSYFRVFRVCLFLLGFFLYFVRSFLLCLSLAISLLISAFLPFFHYFFLSVNISLCLSVFLSFCLSVVLPFFLSVLLSFFLLSLFLSFFLSLSLSLYEVRGQGSVQAPSPRGSSRTCISWQVGNSTPGLCPEGGSDCTRVPLCITSPDKGSA